MIKEAIFDGWRSNFEFKVNLESWPSVVLWNLILIQALYITKKENFSLSFKEVEELFLVLSLELISWPPKL